MGNPKSGRAAVAIPNLTPNNEVLLEFDGYQAKLPKLFP